MRHVSVDLRAAQPGPGVPQRGGPADMAGRLQRDVSLHPRGGPRGQEGGVEDVQGAPVLILVPHMGDGAGGGQGQGGGGRRLRGEAHGLVHRLRRERPVGARELHRRHHMGLGGDREGRQAGHRRVGQRLRRRQGLRPDEEDIHRREELPVGGGRGGQGALRLRRERVLHPQGRQAGHGDIVLRGPVQQVLHADMVQPGGVPRQVGLHRQVSREGGRVLRRRRRVRDTQGRGELPHMQAQEVPPGAGLRERPRHQGRGQGGHEPPRLLLPAPEASHGRELRGVDGHGGPGQGLRDHAREGVQDRARDGLHRRRRQPHRHDSQVPVRRPVQQRHDRAHGEGLQAQEGASR